MMTVVPDIDMHAIACMKCYSIARKKMQQINLNQYIINQHEQIPVQSEKDTYFYDQAYSITESKPSNRLTVLFCKHNDDIMTSMCFLYNWPFVRGIQKQ